MDLKSVSVVSIILNLSVVIVLWYQYFVLLFCVLGKFFLWLQFFNSMVASVKADPKWAPFTALRYEKLGLLISASDVGLPITLRLTNLVKPIKADPKWAPFTAQRYKKSGLPIFGYF